MFESRSNSSHFTAEQGIEVRARTSAWIACIVCSFLSLSHVSYAQETGVRTDTSRLASTLRPRGITRPPLSPGKAFLTSFALPGYAQARFDRGSAGALFVAVELGALAMVKRSSDQVREARRFLNDSLPTDFTVGTDGTLTPVARSSGGFTMDLVRRRRLHLEDWLAVIAFNHLLAGADAFVSAQLWDLPAALSAYPSPGGGAVVVATIRW